LTQLGFNSAPTYWRCEAGWFWHARPLRDHLLWCVLDGVGELTLDGHRDRLGPGSCAVFRPGDAPMARHDPRRRLLVFGMHFDTDSPADLPPPGPIRVPDLTLLDALARRCDRGFRRGGPLGARHSRLCLEQLLLTETRMSVTQVAAAPGYVDVAYFSRPVQAAHRPATQRRPVTLTAAPLPSAARRRPPHAARRRPLRAAARCPLR